MEPTKKRFFWRRYCKMTCRGGSEKGLCKCRGPSECLARNDPDFRAQRRLANERMFKVFGLGGLWRRLRGWIDRL